MYFACAAGLAVMAAVGAGPNSATQPPPALQAEQMQVPEALQFAPYQGYGSLTVLDSGEVIIRLDGDPPASSGGREPLATWTLMADTEGLVLVNAGGDYFLDRNSAEMQRRGLAQTDATITRVENDSGADGCQHSSLLTIKGELVFEWEPETGRGHVMAASGGSTFSAEFALAQVEAEGSTWRPWSCSIRCGVWSHCWVVCRPLFYARCYCDTDGYARCECLPRGGGLIELERVPAGSGTDECSGAQLDGIELARPRD